MTLTLHGRRVNDEPNFDTPPTYCQSFYTSYGVSNRVEGCTVPQMTPGLVANYAVRVFLQRAGERYDRARGLKPFIRDSSAHVTIAQFFDGRCPYCDTALSTGSASEDHLVPINKTDVGLHAWGNVVLACSTCNGKKHHGDWRTYVRSISSTNEDFARRSSRIESFQREYAYAPGAGLADLAEALHAEVPTLIEASLRDAEVTIAQLGQTEEPRLH